MFQKKITLSDAYSSFLFFFYVKELLFSEGLKETDIGKTGRFTS